MRFSWLTKQSGLTLLLLLCIDIIFFRLLATHLSLKSPYLSLTLSLIMFILAYYTIKYMSRLDKGSDGEDAVRRELEKLPEGYTHVNDFNYNNRSSADIVVIGPTGIFTLEVKNYNAREITYANDELLRDGKSFHKNVLKQAYAEAKNLQSYLATQNISTPVHPVIVFTNKWTTMKFGLHQQRGVYVVALPWLIKLVQEQESILTYEECLDIQNVLKKYSSII